MIFYKETNFGDETVIGRIPMGWKVVRIGEICEFKRGFSYRSDQITQDMTNTRFFTINDYEKEGGFKQNGERLYLRDEVNVDSDFILNKDDVLIANTDMSRGFIIGAPIHIENVEGKLVYSMDSTKLIFDENEIDGKFLFYLLKHEKVRRKMKTFAQGTNVLHLNHELVKSLRIPLPSLSEQRGIVGVLGVVDSVIAKTGEVIAKTERLKKGLMQTLLTRGIGHKEYKQTPIGTLPQAWNVSELGDIATEVHRYPTYFNIGYVDKGIPEVRGELIREDGELENDLSIYRFISEETSQKFPRTILKEGDFVLSVRGTMGKVAIVPKSLEGANITANLIRISLERSKCYPPFYKQFFLSDAFTKTLNNVSSQTTIKTIQAPILKRIKVPLPPLNEQKKIAEILSAADRKLEIERKEKARFERIKRGLMDLLLTGKIRIKVD
jgi:type I restriction enzyme S subunit